MTTDPIEPDRVERVLRMLQPVAFNAIRDPVASLIRDLLSRNAFLEHELHDEQACRALERLLPVPIAWARRRG